MDSPNLQFGRVNFTILNGGNDGVRAAHIGKLVFDYLRELMERDLQRLGADVTLAQLVVPPIQVSLDTMDDDAVARACAEGIHRALLTAI